ncbi:hypothetical protein CISG_04680 [Coccidioides immitis RMSCC 3703]|uniref:Uncharacterized protein n=2 Tax=Coccidioides immitis TaxID=5501 RepID=A0A0J8QPC1_COCIT|nr:hypothetical protein CIRG_01228 [Coccidioides immitis RMSCC 2394]KMU74331.1 hypothetical protein CISG_04680 [Coccidioides immitis RMSCC 3703]
MLTQHVDFSAKSSFGHAELPIVTDAAFGLTLKVLRLRLGPGGSLCVTSLASSGPRSVGRGERRQGYWIACAVRPRRRALQCEIVSEHGKWCRLSSTTDFECFVIPDHIQVAFGIMSVQELSLTNLSSFRDTRLGFLFAWGTITLLLLKSDSYY